MASAGLLRLLNSGLQDDRLLPPDQEADLDPLKQRATKGGRFTTELVRVDFDNRPSFGVQAKATIPRKGHLITRAYLVARMPDIRTQQQAARAWCQANGKDFAGPTFGWTNSLGHALVSQAQVTIAASPIDTIDGRLLEVLDEFHTPLEKTTTVNRLLKRKDHGFTPTSFGFSTTNEEVVVPLPFWFTRDPAAALPIDAIGTDPVQINITFSPLASVYVSTAHTFNTNGQDSYFPLPSSPFYYIDNSTTPTSSQLVKGLNGNPAVAAAPVSKVPAIQMPAQDSLLLQDSYLLLEYVYIDQPEANRIRLADLSYPIVQHYAIPPYDSKGMANVRIPMRVPNPTREFYFMVHRQDADPLNAPFLATRDLSGLPMFDLSGVGPTAPWWPDASGLNTTTFLPLIPAFSELDSEAIDSFALQYEGKIVRYATDSPAFFRSILQAVEQTKTPWHNKYYYHIPFGTQHEQFGITNPMGHANLDKVQKVDLAIQFKPMRGSQSVTNLPSYTIYVWAETYNILRVYGGRAGLLFGY
jgi:hypothetical protein